MDNAKPVIMVVTATITGAQAYKAYMTALVESGLFARHGAVPLATGPVFEALEGDFQPEDITALIEFPSIDAANAFWECAEYRQIAKLRETAGDFRVGLWRKFRAPVQV